MFEKTKTIDHNEKLKQDQEQTGSAEQLPDNSVSVEITDEAVDAQNRNDSDEDMMDDAKLVDKSKKDTTVTGISGSVCRFW